MSASYQVTATALNLRSTPGTDGTVLAVLRNGQLCLGRGPQVGTWLPVTYSGQIGYVAADYVRSLDTPNDASTASNVDSSGSNVMLPTAPQTRMQDPSQLHPHFRALLNTLLQSLANENLPFRVFEAFRTPERQQWLYEQGRTRPGGIVTKAMPWTSFHQFGLATDLVLFIDGQWSWNDSGALAQHWARLRELATQAGLRSLSFEAPHVELPATLQDAAGPGLIAAGDDTWFDTLSSAATRWRNSGASGAPDLRVAERPALPAQAGQA